MFVKKYVPLGIKTEFSVRKSLIKIRDLAGFLKSNGFNAAGIADYDFSGHHEFNSALSKAGIKPIFGLEARVSDDIPVFLYALSKPGYLELIRLLNGFFHQKDGLTILSCDTFISPEIASIIPVRYIREGFPLTGAANCYAGIGSHADSSDLLRLSKHGLTSCYLDQVTHLSPDQSALFETYSGTSGCHILTDQELTDRSDLLESLAHSKSLAENSSFSFQDYVRLIRESWPDEDFACLEKLVLHHCQKTGNDFENLRDELDWIRKNHLTRMFLLYYQLNSHLIERNLISTPLAGKFSHFKVALVLGLNRSHIAIESSISPFANQLDFSFHLPFSSRNALMTLLNNTLAGDTLVYPLLFNHFQSFSARRETGKCLKIPYYITDSLAKKNSSSSSIVPESKVKEFHRLHSLLKGMVHFFQKNSSAFFLLPPSVKDLFPTFHLDNTLVCPYSKDLLDSLGVPRIHISGMKILDVIQDTLSSISSTSDVSIRLDHIEPADSKIYSSLCRHSDGLFFLDNPKAKSLVQIIRPRRLQELTLIIGLLISTIDFRPKLRFPPFKKIIGDFHYHLVFADHAREIFKLLGFDYLQRSRLFELLKKGELFQHSELKADLQTRLEKLLGPEQSTLFFELLHTNTPKLLDLYDIQNYALISYWTAFLKTNFFTDYFCSLLNADWDNPPRLRKYSEIMKKKRCTFSVDHAPGPVFRMAGKKVLVSFPPKSSEMQSSLFPTFSLEDELKTWNFFLSPHPLSHYTPWLRFLSSTDLVHFLDGRFERFGAALCLLEKTEKSIPGGILLLTTWSDGTNEIHAEAINPACPPVITRCYYVEGSRYNRHKEVRLSIEHIMPLELFFSVCPLCIKITEGISESAINQLYTMIKSHPGDRSCYLLMPQNKKHHLLKIDQSVEMTHENMKLMAQIPGVTPSYFKPVPANYSCCP
ncbi:MAG: PHP domain-containing protein [Candidatus Wallbacteria bacterium]|nr:PHP domain-containing protein [Candidatus Wallbacteria bacterium]